MSCWPSVWRLRMWRWPIDPQPITRKRCSDGGHGSCPGEEQGAALRLGFDCATVIWLAGHRNVGGVPSGSCCLLLDIKISIVVLFDLGQPQGLATEPALEAADGYFLGGVVL